MSDSNKNNDLELELIGSDSYYRPFASSSFFDHSIFPIGQMQ
ncbi:MAG: hypothetical protein ACI8O8_002720 [Oleiphilaceae bacterium]|jgi:hypothetical protein